MNRHLSDRDHVEAILSEKGQPLQPFKRSIGGEVFHPGSSEEWQVHQEHGVIHADSPYEALLKLITGFGERYDGDDDIGILPDAECEISLSISPLETDE